MNQATTAEDLIDVNGDGLPDAVRKKDGCAGFDYGQPVIMGLGTVPLNPVRIAVTLAYAFAAKEQAGDRLRELYDVWAKKRT